MANKPISFNAEDIFGKVREYEDLMEEINGDEESRRLFYGIPEEKRMPLLDFLAGKCSLDILYDSFFRKIFDPELHKDRLESLISALMGQEAKIHSVLSREGFQISDKGSLVIMDIIVRLKDDSLVNVELQKIGYRFPSQRSSCYVSDMIMRQYNEKRAQNGDKFNYRDIAPVYLLVIIAKSSSEFSKTEEYMHRREVSYSSGIELTETARITYITLDTFMGKPHNIDGALEAWLTFLTRDDLGSVLELVNRHPEFADIYRDIAEFRKDPKELIGMFSEALKIMDHNTELFMIDEMKDEINALKEQMNIQKQEFRRRDKEHQQELQQKEGELQQKEGELQQKEGELQQKDEEIKTLREKIRLLGGEVS